MGQIAVRDTQGWGGRRTVTYRNAAGKTFDALVVGPGSVSGVKLKLTSFKEPTYVDNVPLATSYKGNTPAYFNQAPRI